MAKLFLNPNLPNYFQAAEGVTREGADKSYVPDYEAGKVITFPKLSPAIDYDFWSTLPADDFPELKKLSSEIDLEDFTIDRQLDRRLAKSGIGASLAADVRHQIQTFYESVLPAYMQVFAGYSFTNCRAVWRLTTTRNENMHFDTYLQDFPQHFARMFINIDTQPRIWQTSWRADEAFKMFGHHIPDEMLRNATATQIWIELNKVIFGGSSKMWWDTNPRHVAYFDPGDVWIVDSRQVAHQIFYGRRAVSIDFFVDANSMLDQRKHYLTGVEAFRAEQRQARRLEALA